MVDSIVNVYVTDTNNYRIQKFSSDGDYLRAWGEKCKVEDSGVAGCDGNFNIPAGVAVDSARNIYVTDRNNDRIQKFDPNGTFLGRWGEECVVKEQGLEYCNGDFSNPMGISIDTEDNVYVAELANDRIQKFRTVPVEKEPVPTNPIQPSPTPPSLSYPAPVASPAPEVTYESACNLKITSPRVRMGKSGSAKLSARNARRLFTRGLKGYVQWGTVVGNKVVCKSLKMAILQKRGKRYYVPGTKTRISSKYLSAKGISTKGARFLRKKKVGKLTQKQVSKKRRTDISFKEFNRRSKLGKKALRSLKRKRYRGTYVIFYTAKVGKTTVSKKITLKVSGKKQGRKKS